jgi:sugar phosphate isomerase/epimerase
MSAAELGKGKESGELLTHLTMLAEMMDRDLEAAVSQLAELNITQLDLKNHVFDRAIDDLDDERRERLAALLEQTGSSIYCFSSTLGHRNLSEVGERAFRKQLHTGIANMAETAKSARPAKVRLLSCWFDGRDAYVDANEYLETKAPWVYTAYREAIDQIADAGLAATIENEPHTILSNPDETIAFFARLERPAASFTWDVQNMWQSGSYPSLDAYQTLRPVMDYFHLKGGRESPDVPGQLVYRCALEQASWPVREIVGAVLADGASPVICLNPSHGKVAEGYELAHLAGRPEMIRAEALRDVAFLRANFGEIA